MRSNLKREERRMKRNAIIMGSIMVFIMIFSMLAVYVNNADNNSNMQYNGFTFKVEQVQGGQMVSTKVNGQKYLFYTLPETTKTALGNIDSVQKLIAAQSIIFTKAPLKIDEQATSERLIFNLLANDVQTLTTKLVLQGVTEEDPVLEQTIYNCNNATISRPVVILESGFFTGMNLTEVSANCYNLAAGDTDILVLRDYFIYKSLGIITD